MLHHEFPILEFDEDRNAFIRPERLIKPIDISERAVICFFADAIESVIAKHPHKIVASLRGEGLTLPVYELDYNGHRVVLVQAIVGAPWAAAHIEELTAYGCRKYVACGGCGVLQKELAVGHLIIPTTAVRDEGTSYHYAAPSREISMCERTVQAIEETLTEHKVPYIKGKTWTTDAIFRETPAKVQHRKQEGCVAVEMEASAFMAAAQYNQVTFGQILYAGDSLAGEEWDNRGWHSRTEIRELVLNLALSCCLKMQTTVSEKRQNAK
ncbi:MAG: nucleoside phosphorylase [Defluviitaleaceae bacterium]|nr:nucleoside phosphorylase [Defluviitaleaceae bacterium]